MLPLINSFRLLHFSGDAPCTGLERGMGSVGLEPPPQVENHKALWFISSTGPISLKSHKDTKPAFSVGP